MHPHQDTQLAPWQDQFAPVFAWAASQDPAYFQRLTWAETAQHETVLAMFHGWVDELAAQGATGAAPLRESLATMALIQQYHDGQLDSERLLVELVDAVRPPWTDQPVARALAQLDPALTEEVQRIDQDAVLVTRLHQAFGADDGFALTMWSLQALEQATQTVEELFPYFADACDAHLRSYLPSAEGEAETLMDLPDELMDLARDALLPEHSHQDPTAPDEAQPAVQLDYLDPDRFGQVLRDCPELRGRLAHYNTEAYAFNLAGPHQGEHQPSVLDAVDAIHQQYLRRQPAVLGRVAALVGADGRIGDPDTARLAESIGRWEELREACGGITAQLLPGFAGYPEAEPDFLTELPAPVFMTDHQWQQVVQAVPRLGVAEGRIDKRLVLDAITYQRRTGCAWEQLPHRYPPHLVVSTLEEMWAMDRTLSKVEAILG